MTFRGGVLKKNRIFFIKGEGSGPSDSIRLIKNIFFLLGNIIKIKIFTLHFCYNFKYGNLLYSPHFLIFSINIKILSSKFFLPLYKDQVIKILPTKFYFNNKSFWNMGMTRIWSEPNPIELVNFSTRSTNDKNISPQKNFFFSSSSYEKTSLLGEYPKFHSNIYKLLFVLVN